MKKNSDRRNNCKFIMKNSEADLHDTPTVVEWVDNNFIHLSIIN